MRNLITRGTIWGVTRRDSILYHLLPIADLLIAAGLVYLAPACTEIAAPYFGWQQVPDFNAYQATPILAGCAIAAVPVLLRIVGFYHSGNRQRISTALNQLLTFLVYYLGVFGLYVISRSDESSSYINHVILTGLVLIIPSVFLRYYLLCLVQQHTVFGRRNLRQVLLAGTEQNINTEWEKLPAAMKKTLSVVGRVVEGKTTQEQVQELIENNHVQQLMLFGGLDTYRDMSETILRCELQGIDIYIHLNSNHPVVQRATVREIGEQRVLILTSTPDYSWGRMLKSIIGRVLALLGIIATSPLWIVAAVGIKISDPKGKVFYRQQRSGLYGKPFGMWKFRSMYSDADKRLDEIKAKYGNEMDGPIFKLTNDPRIFPFGHFIRKYSIDELPQLINVLTGDMSIVGPRPLPTYETAEFPEISQRRRMSVKPGLTCYWQIEDRSDCKDFDRLIAKDLKYIDNWNLWTDFVLILRTIPVAIFGKGAK